MNEAFARSLIEAQKAMPPIAKDALNPHFKSAFTSLDHLLAEALPILNDHGIALAQYPTFNDHGQPTLTTHLIHESGEMLSGEMPLLLQKQDPQGHGAAITYAKRFSASSALGISSEVDDDAESTVERASQNQPARRDTPAQDGVPGQVVIHLGKHKGKTIGEVAATDKGYVGWLSAKFEPKNDDDQRLVLAAGAFLHDEDIPF